ncbi:MAG: hypothetical protein AUK47_21490 [Deltaproteobacteria bacterium CG2_30_63_29]|nr:MAG: hypothetical protein AUK47_21490 [Deltaproteobacteria bacterium CG2_30_63_29]
MKMKKYELVVERLTAPAVIIHGGAGAYLHTTTIQERVERGRSMAYVAETALSAVLECDARTGVLTAIASMELDPIYNAGFGCKLQQDGTPRVSAALMDGHNLRFSGVINVTQCLHPSRLANVLQDRGDRILDDLGARRLMKELGTEPTELRTDRTIARWRELCRTGDLADAEGAIADAGVEGLHQARKAASQMPTDLPNLRKEWLSTHDDPDDDRFGTVGAVVLDAAGHLWVCTSTGGRGHEVVGRISDSAMPAGTYACPLVALSATGFGEQIVDINLCGRIATRIIDGLSLEAALAKTFEEVVSQGGLMGVIAMTRDGVAGYAYTTEACGVAWADAAGVCGVDEHGRP